jgi:hypothetical protein
MRSLLDTDIKSQREGREGEERTRGGSRKSKMGSLSNPIWRPRGGKDSEVDLV